MPISFSETVGWGCPRLSVSGCCREQGLHPSPLALMSDGKTPAGSHLMLGVSRGYFEGRQFFREGWGLCQCAGLCVSRAAAGHLGYLQTQFSVDTGNYPHPHFPPLLEPGSWAPEVGSVVAFLPAAQTLPAHTRAGMEERDGGHELGALGEGWPGECWRQLRAGWEPLTLTHSSRAALSPTLVIKLPVLQLLDESVHP